MASLNIYQMYHQNNCRFGFKVRKDSWSPNKYATVTSIQWVFEGKPIKGNPPYFGGFKNPPGHPRAGKIMGPREVVLEAPWINGGSMVVNGGTGNWIMLDMPSS